MLCLLYSIAYVNRLMGMYVLKIGSHVECNGIDHSARAVVLQLKLDVFHVFSNEFACSEVEYISGAEYRILVSGSEWIEFF